METGLPRGWSIRLSKTHNTPYFVNLSTLESTWEIPQGSDDSTTKAYLEKFKANGNKPLVADDGKVRVSHLLIKNETSRRPKSWKSPEGITLTRDESIAKLKAFRETILSGQSSLADMAQNESDCSSHERCGDLGFFGKGQMQPAFEQASFNLNVGEFSDIIETDSGVHLLERTG